MKLENITVQYLDHLGGDLTVVNAARVSFDKHQDVLNEEKDSKLINYLAKHKHFTPFCHPQVTVRVTAPIFVARQAFKHKIGLIENEISRRYVDFEPSLFLPDDWRGKADNKKQGSSGTISAQEGAQALVTASYTLALNTYEALLELGVCPEQARMVLPQGMNTSWYWTGSLAAFARVYNLRHSPDAQQEIQMLAKQIDNVIAPLFPLSWPALTEQNGKT